MVFQKIINTRSPRTNMFRKVSFQMTEIGIRE